MNDNSFGENLKRLRNEHQISREGLAKELNISTHTIAKYEQKQREPNITTLLKISDFFQISVDELIGARERYINPRKIFFDNGNCDIRQVEKFFIPYLYQYMEAVRMEFTNFHDQIDMANFAVVLENILNIFEDERHFNDYKRVQLLIDVINELYSLPSEIEHGDFNQIKADLKSWLDKYKAYITSEKDK